MRRLTDNQSRHLCRWAFLLLCVLPTALVVIAAANVWRADDWELLIAAELKLDVEIGRVENPRPGQTVLHEVVIRRGAEQLGQARRVECNWMGTWELQLAGASLRTGGLEQLQKSLGQLPDRYGGATGRAWHLRCRDLIVEPPDAVADEPTPLPLRLANVELLSSPAPHESLQLLRLQLAEAPARTDFPVELQVRHALPGGQRQVLARVNEAVPVWFLSALGCLPSGWDRELLFRGTLEFRQLGDAASSGQVDAAVLSNLDLGWLQRQLGIPLSGRAEIQIPSLSWRDGRINRAEIQVHAAEGQFSRSWLTALCRLPGVRAFEPNQAQATTDAQDYRLFAARFQIQAGSCRVAPITQATAAICWDQADQPLLAVDPPGYVQADLEVLARLSLEPEHPELLADDQLVELLRHFHLPPDTRSARTPSATELR